MVRCIEQLTIDVKVENKLSRMVGPDPWRRPMELAMLKSNQAGHEKETQKLHITDDFLS